jgi:hypothetical protein
MLNRGPMRWGVAVLVALACSLHVAADLGADMGADMGAAPAANPAAENAALRQRVAALETEVERLRAENRRLAELAGLVPEAEMVEVERAHIATRQDPDTGATTTATRWVDLPIAVGSRSNHHMMVTMDELEGPRLVVSAHFTGRIYQGLREVSLVVDGREVTRPVADYSSRRRGSAGSRGGSLYSETVTIDLGREVLDQLAQARTAELRMRHVRASLEPEQLAQFKAIAARVE